MKTINLSRNKIAIVDDIMFELLNQFKWSYHHAGYASRTAKHIMMYRFIWEHTNGKILKGLVIDHINGNRLDNRVINLRPVTRSCNSQKRDLRDGTKKKYSVYKGVTAIKYKNSTYWMARITLGKTKSLGNFKTEIEAALAYNKAAIELYGEHAEVNSI